jgi:hypothetical protein
MKAKDKRPTDAASPKREKLSLYPLSIEDALRAALQTGKAPPLKKARTNRQRKKPTKPA